MSYIKLDLNTPQFQDDWFSLTKDEANMLRNTLSRISKLTWEQVHNHKGLNWEKIKHKITDDGNNVYSFRFSNKYRATAVRDEDYLVLLNLHTDHDSAYTK